MIKVINMKEKNQNKQHIVIPQGDAVEGGIVKIFSEGPLTEEIRTMQESHNANHALYYLSLMTYAITHEMRKDWANQSKAIRILTHLSSLSEFIPDEEIKLKEAVHRLMSLLAATTLTSAKAWGVFLRKNWDLFETLSQRYSHDNNNFSRNAYEKLGDAISGRRFIKIWWWKLAMEKIQMKCKKLFTEVKS